MTASNYLEAAVINEILGGNAFNAPGTVYIALYMASPGEGGSANTNETSGTNYSRVSLTNNTTNWPNGNPKSNGVAINFPTPGVGGWASPVTHWGIVDTASGAGNILFYDALTVAKTINQDDTVSFPIGALVVTVD